MLIMNKDSRFADFGIIITDVVITSSLRQSALGNFSVTLTGSHFF